MSNLPVDPQLITFSIFLIMASVMLFIRLKATKKPTSVKKILIPPLGMSTGFIMFLYPPVHIPLAWAGISFLIGMIFFALPLIKTSKFRICYNQIYLNPSRSFLFTIIILCIVRLTLHGYIEQFISIYQTAGLFFILAFGMLLPWRIAMYFQFRHLQQKLSDPVADQ